MLCVIITCVSSQRKFIPLQEYAVYGTCNVSDTQWIKGCGAPIKAYLKSIVPDLHKRSDRLKANFRIKEGEKHLSGIFLDSEKG